MILSDESINCYGFWIKTDGIQTGRFSRNPIMLFNHHRTYRGSIDEILPIGRWENLAVENGVLYGEPVFDENDEFAMKIKKKVEGGFIAGCSIGLKPLTVSDEPLIMKQGQTAPTVTTCELMEVSIVDIPANPNAAAVVLYDEDESVINLAAGGSADGILNKLNKYKMTKEIALKLGLPEAATEQECISAIETLNADKAEMNRLKASEYSLKSELQVFRDREAVRQKALRDQLIGEAIQNGQIDAKAKEHFEQLFDKDFNNAQSVLAAIPKRHSMGAAAKTGEPSKYDKLSWDELDKQCLLPELKAKDIETFKAKFYEKFKKEY